MKCTQMKVDVLVFEGCPHADAALSLVKKVVGRLEPEAPVRRVEIDTPEKAAEIGFLGSPSVRINGDDIERRRTAKGALCCRTYSGNGVPPEWMVELGVIRALKPRGILFLCAANSARSQMAEGIARSLAPEGINIMSAGSHPKSVRPEAIAVLKEIGIDISGQWSKNVSEILPSEVDTVITLCAEEECPLFLGNARRVHWGLPDPAGVQGTEQEQLDEFRKTRDELKLGPSLLFSEEEHSTLF